MINASVPKFGFSLIELLVVISIISILATFSHRLYRQHIIKTHRHSAKIALFQLALKLEHYYQQQHTYVGATLEKLQQVPENEMDYYELKLVKLEKDHFFAQAHPVGSQTEDFECGAFGLDEMGRKMITGEGSIQSCWS